MGGGRDKRKKAKERKEGPILGLGSIKTEKKVNKGISHADMYTVLPTVVFTGSLSLKITMLSERGQK
jgi:hypothetical protein